MVGADRIAEVMGGAAILGRRIRSIGELEQTVSHGIPKGALRHTVERVYSGGDVRDMIFRIVPEATFKRRNLLSPSESARTERLARVIALAEYVWSDKTDAREWLLKPHPELNRRCPVDAALTELGARQVEQLLERLFFGVPS